jgi:hypothetical protein
LSVILASLMFRAKNILNIFSTIKVKVLTLQVLFLVHYFF